MTVVVAVKSEGRVVFGADRQTTEERDIGHTKATPKVFRIGSGLTVGCTVSSRFSQILRWHLDVPPHPKSLSVDRFLITRFVPALRATLVDHHYVLDTDRDEDLKSGVMLLACRDQMAVIHTNYQVDRYRAAAVGVGSGGDLAVAAAVTSLAYDRDPERAARHGVRVASEMSTTCGGGIQIMDHKP